MLPFVIDNQTAFAADVLNRLLARSRACPVDIASAYFNVHGYRLVKDGLNDLGAFRLLLGHEPEHGADVGLRPQLVQRMVGEMAGMPLDEPTMRLVEDLIAFLSEDKVEVRLYEQGFLHAKAYIFHQDRVGRGNFDDRLRFVRRDCRLQQLHRAGVEDEQGTEPRPSRVHGGGCPRRCRGREPGRLPHGTGPGLWAAPPGQERAV